MTDKTWIVMVATDVAKNNGAGTLFGENATDLTKEEAEAEAKRRNAEVKKAKIKGVDWYPMDYGAMMAMAAQVATPAKKTRSKKEKPAELEVVELTEEQADALLDGATDLVTVVKETKRRVQSRAERDEAGKVKRAGKNLSGNQPFRAKLYYYDLDAKDTPEYDKAFNAAPMQVRLIMRYMEENGLTTSDDAERGAEIAGGAINSGMLKSKIDPAALFAYYRRVMERLGLTLASVG